jgi:hypothetical protein
MSNSQRWNVELKKAIGRKINNYFGGAYLRDKLDW